MIQYSQESKEKPFLGKGKLRTNVRLKVTRFVSKYPDLAYEVDDHGRVAIDVASKSMRQAVHSVKLNV